MKVVIKRAPQSRNATLDQKRWFPLGCIPLTATEVYWKNRLLLDRQTGTTSRNINLCETLGLNNNQLKKYSPPDWKNNFHWKNRFLQNEKTGLSTRIGLSPRIDSTVFPSCFTFKIGFYYKDRMDYFNKSSFLCFY